MDETLDLIRQRLEKAERRIQRLNKSLESAQKEYDDLDTTLRVLTGMHASESAPKDTPATFHRQFEILQLLPEGKDFSASPAKLFEAYQMVGSEAITLDTFRTSLWRMKGASYSFNGVDWTVDGEQGVYWKNRGARPRFGFAGQDADLGIEDDDDDVPF